MAFNAPVLTRVRPVSQRATGLSFMSITKRFGDVVALDNVSFDVASGGIHAVVGENGAGKSTLNKILYGYYRPDNGSIYLNGSELILKSPSQARQIGIGMVHQQLALIPALTGCENVVLGDPKQPFTFSKQDLQKQVSARAEELGFKLDLTCPVSNLSIAERQKLEIFKLLWRDARVLILDEPTSQLTPFEAEDILTLVQGLSHSGRIVILITHHITEVMQFAKNITLLRKGKCITTIDASSTNGNELAQMMLDTDSLSSIKSSSANPGPALLSLKNVSTDKRENKRSIKEVNLDIHAGEIIGIAGISDSGQTELGQLIAGLLKPSKGTILCSPDLYVANQSDQELGDLSKVVCYIPSDQKHAYVANLSMAENCFLKSVNAPWSHTLGFIKGSLLNTQAKNIIDTFEIYPPYIELPANTLSGGNLQRLIIGRELSTQAKVIVADNPCAGLDIAMTMQVRQKLRQAAEIGCAVVLISPDLEELISTCDRIIVMFNGCIQGEQLSGQFDYHFLAQLMGGKL